MEHYIKELPHKDIGALAIRYKSSLLSQLLMNQGLNAAITSSREGCLHYKKLIFILFLKGNITLWQKIIHIGT